MPVKEFNGISIEVDDDGHMVDWKEWNEDIARGLARDLGIDELTDDHWKVINFLRSEYEKNGAASTLRTIGKQSGVDIKGLYKIFPEKPLRKSAVVAGLPKPKSCV